jgi:pyrrolidone-carboxylate peptidase
LIPIALSGDPGSYYCSHVFFVAQRFARERGLAGGDAPRVGFLHIPRDELIDGRGGYDPGVRHAALMDVLARALRGLASAGSASILVTGFGAFEDVVDNPTGDFVSRPELCREVRAGLEGVAVEFARLPVDDRALQPDHPSSIQALIAQHEPDAVLMMGVGRAGFCVETVAHDGGLELAGGPRHDEGSPRTVSEENLTLARALGLA